MSQCGKQEEYEEGLKSYKTGVAISATFLSISGGLLLGGLLVNGVHVALGDPVVLGNKYFIINGVVAGASIIGCIISSGHLFSAIFNYDFINA